MLPLLPLLLLLLLPLLPLLLLLLLPLQPLLRCRSGRRQTIALEFQCEVDGEGLEPFLQLLTSTAAAHNVAISQGQKNVAGVQQGPSSEALLQQDRFATQFKIQKSST